MNWVHDVELDFMQQMQLYKNWVHDVELDCKKQPTVQELSTWCRTRLYAAGPMFSALPWVLWDGMEPSLIYCHDIVSILPVKPNPILSALLPLPPTPS